MAWSEQNLKSTSLGKGRERRKILGWVQTAMTSFADVDDVEAWNVLDVSRWRKIFPRRRPRG